jgi:hypothetical protein
MYGETIYKLCEKRYYFKMAQYNSKARFVFESKFLGDEGKRERKY